MKIPTVYAFGVKLLPLQVSFWIGMLKILGVGAKRLGSKPKILGYPAKPLGACPKALVY